VHADHAGFGGVDLLGLVVAGVEVEVVASGIAGVAVAATSPLHTQVRFAPGERQLHRSAATLLARLVGRVHESGVERLKTAGHQEKEHKSQDNGSHGVLFF